MAEPEATQITELDPREAAGRIEQGDAEVVDVRNDDEYAAGHIAGARHLPFERLQEAAGELDRDRPIVFYCRSGDRSGAAAQAFNASGYHAKSIAGGLVAWTEAGLPLEPQDGEVAERSKLPGQ